MFELNFRFMTILGRMWVWSQYSSRWQVSQPSKGTRSYHGSSWHSRVNFSVTLLFVFLYFGVADCFSVCRMNTYNRVLLTFLSRDDTPFEEFEDAAGDDGEIIPDLEWRLVKAKLEEAHTKSFLKSKPRHLPYDECRKWVTAWHRWDCEEDWKEWIDMGEKRNAYIPARPDEYYGGTGQWISWDHFLGKVGNEKGIDEADKRLGEFD